MGTWCSDTVVFFGSFKGLCIVITQNNMVTWCSDTVIVYSGGLKLMITVTTQKIWSLGAVTL